MKRKELVRDLVKSGCVLKRSVGGHDVYHNPLTNRSAPVPRHTEIGDILCKQIKRQLGV